MSRFSFNVNFNPDGSAEPIVVTTAYQPSGYEFETTDIAQNPIKIYGLTTVGHNECRCGIYGDIWTKSAQDILGIISEKK